MSKSPEEFKKDDETLMGMFGTEGWTVFIDRLKEAREGLLQACPHGATSNEQWQYARGQLYQMDQILGCEAFLKATIAQEEANNALDQEGDGY